jgi:hypothetical protein
MPPSGGRPIGLGVVVSRPANVPEPDDGLEADDGDTGDDGAHATVSSSRAIAVCSLMIPPGSE